MYEVEPVRHKNFTIEKGTIEVTEMLHAYGEPYISCNGQWGAYAPMATTSVNISITGICFRTRFYASTKFLTFEVVIILIIEVANAGDVFLRDTAGCKSRRECT